jgi:hypothetical protein
MKILSINDTKILCGIPGGLPGQFEVKVFVNALGLDAIANPATADDFEYKLTINSISPTSGSFNGGTKITITG